MDPNKIKLVTSEKSPEFTQLTESLTRSTLIALDAEWKPTRLTTKNNNSTFPTVTLLQLACQLTDSVSVFLVDLIELPLDSVYHLLRNAFVSPHVLKLGFRFKQDLVYLNSTFCAQGCEPGFDSVEPYLDVASMYNNLKNKQPGKKTRDIKSLAAICLDALGYPLSKELQCSDWSLRPLTEEQIVYAAKDAHCLLEIFFIFRAKVVKEGEYFNSISDSKSSKVNIGLKGVLLESDVCDKAFRTKLKDASEILRATVASGFLKRIVEIEDIALRESCKNTLPMDEAFLMVVRKYGERILLKESDKKPKASKRKKRNRSLVSVIHKEKVLENSDEWQGTPPWDLSLGGDECPKFLCDVMVEGLAKHLRCVGIDAAVPSSRKPEARELIYQAQREKRILLTRDAKLLRHEYLINNQIYRVKSLLKNEQLLEVIETFKIKISEDQLMSRCTKCNGRFIQKPLTTEEAIEAAKGFQRIPSCLFDKNLEFWQCMECHQLYWEGTQYHNAVQKFIDVCRLNG